MVGKNRTDDETTTVLSELPEEHEGGRRMIGIIEIDEEDVSDDRHIILELPIEPERNGMQTVMRVKTNIKFIECYQTD